MTQPQKMYLQRHALDSVTTKHPANLMAEEGEDGLKELSPALQAKDNWNTCHAHQVEMRMKESIKDIFITKDVRVN